MAAVASASKVSTHESWNFGSICKKMIIPVLLLSSGVYILKHAFRARKKINS